MDKNDINTATKSGQIQLSLTIGNQLSRKCHYPGRNLMKYQSEAVEHTTHYYLFVYHRVSTRLLAVWFISRPNFHVTATQIERKFI